MRFRLPLMYYILNIKNICDIFIKNKMIIIFFMKMNDLYKFRFSLLWDIYMDKI